MNAEDKITSKYATIVILSSDYPYVWILTLAYLPWYGRLSKANMLEHRQSGYQWCSVLWRALRKLFHIHSLGEKAIVEGSIWMGCLKK